MGGGCSVPFKSEKWQQECEIPLAIMGLEFEVQKFIMLHNKI